MLFRAVVTTDVDPLMLLDALHELVNPPDPTVEEPMAFGVISADFNVVTEDEAADYGL